MDMDDLRHKRELLVLCKRRKYELDKQAVILGITVDPRILLEREDLAREIALLEHEIAALQHGELPSRERHIEMSEPANHSTTQSRLAAAMTFLLLGLFVLWQREFLGMGWALVSGLCGICGVFGLGLELNRLKRGHIFDNLGCGGALFIVGFSLYHYRYLYDNELPFVLGLGLSSALALYKIALGVFNAFSLQHDR
jgi:hypothetical protein